MLAILIASMIAFSLFQLLSQTRRGVKRITNVIEVDIPYTAFFNQVDKDITGMFAPRSSIESYAEQIKKDKEEAAKKEKEEAEQKQKKEAQKKPKEKPISGVFVLDAHKEHFFMSFLTTGGLQVLESDGTLTPTPYVRRVAYLLQKDPHRPDVYRLMYRFSGDNLDIENMKRADFRPSYELMTGIKEFEVELTVFELAEKEPEKKGEEAEKKGEKPPEKETGRSATIREWNEADIWETYKTLIPAYIKLKGTFEDPSGAEYPFEIMSKVYAYSPFVEKEESVFDALERLAAQIWGGNQQKGANKK